MIRSIVDNASADRYPEMVIQTIDQLTFESLTGEGERAIEAVRSAADELKVVLTLTMNG